MDLNGVGPAPFGRYLNKEPIKICIRSFECMVIFLGILHVADLLKKELAEILKKGTS
jgi:hypothetical protein